MTATVVASAGMLTFSRNAIYSDEITFWSDVASKAPRNVRARVNLGAALNAAGRREEAAQQARIAIQLNPDDPKAHNNLGNVLRFSDPKAAIVEYRAALALDPNLVDAHSNLGNLLQDASPAGAEEHYRAALRCNPDHAESHNNLATLLAKQGRVDEAREHYEAALRCKPDFFQAEKNLRMLAEKEKRNR